MSSSARKEKPSTTTTTTTTAPSTSSSSSPSATLPLPLPVPSPPSSSTNATATAPTTDKDGIRRNAKGGIYVNPAELHSAFEFFDVDGKGFITIADLKKRLGVFYQNLSLREYKFLMNNKQELSEQELYQLLANNELNNYDPVAEAFKIYDPNDSGFIDLDVFREILGNLGFGDISDQDIQTLIDTADMDGDGKVSLADFRRMLPSHHQNSIAAAPTTAGGGGAAAVLSTSESQAAAGGVISARGALTPSRASHKMSSAGAFSDRSAAGNSKSSARK